LMFFLARLVSFLIVKESLTSAFIGRALNLLVKPSISGQSTSEGKSTQLRMPHALATKLGVYDSGSDEDNTSHPLQEICDQLLLLDNMDAVAERPTDFMLMIQAIEGMKKVSLKDLRVSSASLPRLPYGLCMTVANCPNRFDISAFLLPKNFPLTLHDHPKMAVCSMLLYGEARIRSFSRSPSSSSSPSTFPSDDDDNSGMFTAQLCFDTIKTSEDGPWLLTSNEGNYHEIIPLQDCVMMDIILPPYDEDRDRNCTFYSSIEIEEGRWQLSPLSPADQARIRLPVIVPYKGFKPQLL